MPAEEQIDAQGVAIALGEVRQRISAAGGGVEVSILPVTKGFGADAVEAAVAAGAKAVGENYVQEMLAKFDALASANLDVDYHMIGQLQTNKVRMLAGRIALYETVDRARLAREIAKRDAGASVLIQVDTTDESGKGGHPISTLDAFVDEVRELGLTLRGLMTVGPTSGDPEAARPGFALVRAAVDRHGLAVCSMGMSGDLEIAVQEGSTQLRIGTALFGERTVRT